MPQTFAQKLLARKAGLPAVDVGQIVAVTPDVILSHDNTAYIADAFRRMGGRKVFDPDRLAIFADHAVPAPTARHAENHKRSRQFALEQGVSHYFPPGRGVCHQVLVEAGLALPGRLVVGADSHTPHAGVMGALACGIGRSEVASVWILGELWLMVPESLRIEVAGRLPPGVSAKDLALRVIGDLGADAALYMSVEWHGEAVAALGLDQRAVLTNMAAEMGAKNGYIPPDAATFDFLRSRTRRPFEPVYPDPGADYARVFACRAEETRPMVACPHTVDNVRPLAEVAGTRVQQAFLGACTNGRLEDLKTAAETIGSRKVHPDTRLVVIPASAEVYLAALRAGYIETLVAAGAMVDTPGCGPCLGNHLGVPAAGETVVSSANRNFRGRMGTPEAEIYLAGPNVVAASAVAGCLTHPDDL